MSACKRQVGGQRWDTGSEALLGPCLARLTSVTPLRFLHLDSCKALSGQCTDELCWLLSVLLSRPHRCFGLCSCPTQPAIVKPLTEHMQPRTLRPHAAHGSTYAAPS